MREVKVYQFEELTDEAKEKAIEQLWGVNVVNRWWAFIYEDAAAIGLEITGFDLGRGAWCNGTWTEDAEDTARLILHLHGKVCETYKNATEFLDAVSIQGVESDEYDELCEEFRRTICEDYRIMLHTEYAHLISAEAIIETIAADGYEFTEDGKLY
jgi:hypothetical protein